MADPDATPRPLRFPVWTFAVRKARQCTRLTAELRQARHDLEVVTAERDRARLIATTLEDELESGPGWDEGEFEAFVRSLGERPA